MLKQIKKKENFHFRSEKVNIMGYFTFESLFYLLLTTLDSYLGWNNKLKESFIQKEKKKRGGNKENPSSPCMNGGRDLRQG